MQVNGFDQFMLTIGSHLLRESVYGTVYRVVVGAFMSTLDAVTDVYVIYTYYGSDELVERANLLLAMCCTSLFCQILITLDSKQEEEKELDGEGEGGLAYYLFLAAGSRRVPSEHKLRKRGGST